MFKNLTQFASLMRNVGQITIRAKELKSSLQQQRVHGTADEGRVAVQLNGLGQVQVISISPDLVHLNHHDRLEELILTAVNQAISEARRLHIEAIRELTGGMELPGMEELIKDL